MAAKRAREHTVDSPPCRANLGDGKVKSSKDFAKPVYLVAPLMSEEPAHSVFMVEAAAVADGDEPPRARTVAGLPGSRHAMSFVATHSEQGSWIVGVGGIGGGTIIYDPVTMKTVRGPDLAYPKRKPILISLGSKVYAISRRPRVHDSKFDFEPWFESLSFRKGVPSIYRHDLPSWKSLPAPPFFPCFLDPIEYRNPPRTSVASYAAVGSHILISLDCSEVGTYAFHVVEKTWEKVCDENLPFVGQAVPLGGSLFAACYAINLRTTAAILHISINSSLTSVASSKLTTSVLSILEYPVSSVGDPLPHLCPNGKGSFCFTWLGPSRRIHKASHANDLQIILTTFKIDNMDSILAACQTESAEAKDLQVPVQVKHQNQTYKLHGPSAFRDSPMPVIASLSIREEGKGRYDHNRLGIYTAVVDSFIGRKYYRRRRRAPRDVPAQSGQTLPNAERSLQLQFLQRGRVEAALRRKSAWDSERRRQRHRGVRSGGRERRRQLQGAEATGK
ncbi:hypothetical protein EJB05_18483 [Eragrostis curvula]|uniref:Uncharacterized protein n=1 Tax=Eragrostis curvula TaxID=38414 RepID=A0A5J9VM54_9POAL|nr:hypothetical protein EJB05_18483 [Eragrostis curvula]